MDFKSALTEFINYERMIGSQKKTISHYSDVLRGFQSVIQISDCASLSIADVYRYVEYLDGKGLSVATKANYLRHIKTFYHFLCRSSVIAEKTLWQDIRLPKSDKKIVRIYDEMEIADIYAACDVSVDWISFRNRCIVTFMLDCGLRQSEVVQLTHGDVLTDYVLVHGKGRKDRLVPKGKKLQEDLRSWRLNRPYSEYESLFVSKNIEPITKDTIKMLFQKISKKVGYPVSSHRLRHNFATNYLMDSYEKNGWFDSYSLMVLLGHEDIKTTERYLHYCQQVVACRNAHSHLDKIYGLG